MAGAERCEIRGFARQRRVRLGKILRGVDPFLAPRLQLHILLGAQVLDGAARQVTEIDGVWLVNALTPISDFNDRFGSAFLDEEFDTIGGMVTAEFGHLPETGEEISFGGFDFHVSKADDRRVHQFTVRVHAK